MSFKAVEDKIAAKQHVPEKTAGAILAKSSRDASPAAKKANPNLEKVKGSSKPTFGGKKFCPSCKSKMVDQDATNCSDCAMGGR
jgi:hypothetical protein